MNSTLHTGSQYVCGTRAPDIAKKIREDLKAAQAAGEIPGKAEGFKYLVRSKSYSGGKSVSIHIVGPDSGEGDGQSWARRPSEPGDRNYGQTYGAYEWTDQALALSPFIQAIGESYVRSDIDSMTDYFNVSCWINVYIGDTGLCAPRGY